MSYTNIQQITSSSTLSRPASLCLSNKNDLMWDFGDLGQPKQNDIQSFNNDLLEHRTSTPLEVRIKKMLLFFQFTIPFSSRIKLIIYGRLK